MKVFMGVVVGYMVIGLAVSAIRGRWTLDRPTEAAGVGLLWLPVMVSWLFVWVAGGRATDA